mgnify:CR=1 FL=1
MDTPAHLVLSPHDLVGERTLARDGVVTERVEVGVGSDEGRHCGGDGDGSVVGCDLEIVSPEAGYQGGKHGTDADEKKKQKEKN